MEIEGHPHCVPPPPKKSESGEDSVVIVDDDEDVQEILDDGDGMEAPLPKTPILPFRVWGGPPLLPPSPT